MPRHHAFSGFTLIELLVTLTIVAMFTVMGLPSMSGLVRDSQVRSTTSDLQDLLQFARSTAITTRAVVTVSATADGTWRASTGQGTALRTLRILKPGATAISANATALRYQPSGTASGARFTLCQNNLASSGYQLDVLLPGYTRVSQQGRLAADSSRTLTHCGAQ